MYSYNTRRVRQTYNMRRAPKFVIRVKESLGIYLVALQGFSKKYYAPEPYSVGTEYLLLLHIISVLRLRLLFKRPVNFIHSFIH